jgi:uncharacterized protein YndB with AHSA1/START domain
MTKTTESTALEIKRIFDAPPSRVFAAWLDRQEWQAWIGPEGVRCDVPLLEARVGGRYSLLMHLGDGQTLPVAGVFTAIEPDKGLAFTWGREGEGQGTLITITLRDQDGGTELTLRQEGLPTVALRDGHARGWKSALNKLAAHLSAVGR